MLKKLLNYVIIISLLFSLISSQKQVYALDAWDAPTLQYPAQIYWGGYANMDQLVQEGAQWDYVKKNMDGFLFHGAFWNNNETASQIGPKLAAMLEPFDKKLLIEGGFPHPPFPTDGSVGNIGVRTGQMDGAMVQAIRGMGFDLNQMTSNYNLYFSKMIKNYQTDYNTKELLVEATGDRLNYPEVTRPENNYWVDYYSQIVKTYPNIQYSHTNSPVYMSWDSYSALSPFALAFRNINITGKMLVESTFNGANTMIGKRMTGFVMDSPYAYFNWPGQGGVDHRAKIRAIERWLHENDYTNTFVVNADGLDSLSPDEADQKYYNDSMAGFKLYQAEGGRANTYLFESWYPWPYTVAPENKSGSYTNLVKDAIKYLKGIGEDYSFEKLDLKIKENGDTSFFGSDIYNSEPGDPQYLTQVTNNGAKTYTVQMQNKGDVECMPHLRALERGSNEWHISYNYNGNDITSQVLSNDGYTFVSRLAVGATISVTVTVTPNGAGNGSERAFDLVAFWNPQDPTGKIRDVVSGSVTRDVSVPDTLRASGQLGVTAASVQGYQEPLPTGVYEAENASLNGVGIASNWPNYSGVGFTDSWDAMNDSATFTVDGQLGGNKQLLIPYANALDSDRTLSLYVNNVKVKQLRFPMVKSGDWSKWGIVSARTVLNPGNNTITLKYDNGDNGIVNIDGFTVVESTIYDAEDAQVSGVDTIQKVQGYTGDGYIYDWNNVGDSYELSIDGGTGGSTSLDFTYANGSGSTKTVSLYVNGRKIRQIGFPATSNWSSWTTLNSGNINLNVGRGNNSIVLKVDSGDTGGIILDKIKKSGDAKAYSAEGQTVDNGVMLRGTKIGAAAVIGSGYLSGWTATGNYAQFATYSTHTGTKTLSLRYINETGVDKTLSLYVNGVKLRQIVLPTYESTNSWPAWRNLNEVIPLGSGNTTIKLQKDAGDSGEVLIDCIELIDGSVTMSSLYQSQEASQATSIYEAENAVLNGVSTDKNVDPTDCDYYTGLGYTTGWNVTNDSAVFNVNSQTNNVKLLKIYYQNTSDVNAKTASLYINGVKVTQMLLAPGDQDGDPGYFSQRGMSVYKKYVQLNSGNNDIMIRLDNGDTGFNRLDKITLTDCPVSISKTDWVASASSSASGEEAVNAINNDLVSRWTSGQFQAANNWFQVDMGSTKQFNKIVLASAGGDYPRAYSVYVSNDGQNWGNPVASGEGYYTNDIEMTFPQKSARFFKIVQTGSSSSNYWSINELYVFNALKVESYEAETSVVSNVGVNTDHSHYTGEGFTDGWDNQNDSVSFIVDGGAAGGTKDLRIRYAVGNASTRTLSLYVNGVKVKQLSFPATLNWDTWGSVMESVTINSGVNTIMLRYDAGDNGIINVDNMDIITK